MQRRDPMTADHARHDRLLVTRFAAGDAYDNEVSRARRLVADCPECAALANDIRLIAARAGDLPIARRRRDFRLSAAEADRLRGSALQRVLRRLAAPGFAALRPVAGVAMAAGLALAVIGALPLTQFSAGAPSDALDRVGAPSAAAPEAASEAPDVAPSPELAGAPSHMPQPAKATTGPEAPDDMNFDGPSGHQGAQATVAPPETVAGPGSAASNVPSSAGVAGVEDSVEQATASPESRGSTGTVEAAEPGASDPNRALIYGGLAMAGLAAGLLLLAWLARRRFSDPLLR